MRENQPGVKVGEIKEALAYNKEIAENPDESYGAKEGEWNIYDKNIYSFEDTFAETLPKFDEQTAKEGYSKLDCLYFRDYIEKTLSKNGGKDLTAVEFGGPGSNLFAGFSGGFFRQTLGVCLKDVRSKKKTEEDRAICHDVLQGDIMEVRNNNLLNEIKKRLSADKIDLIISRMAGPLSIIEKNGAMLDRLIRNWYNLLDENGLMFIQFNYVTNSLRTTQTEILIKKWVEAISYKFPEIDISLNGGSIRLHKRKGSPEELPTAYQLFNK